MTKIAIVGCGYVGRAMARFFARNYPLVLADTEWDVAASLGMDIKKAGGQVVVPTDEHVVDAVNSCDVGVICVPTPRDEKTGVCDTTIVAEVLQWVKTPLVIIKSTVAPGTTDRFQSQLLDRKLVFAPEYASESTYWTPYPFHTEVVETPWFIFGGHPDATAKAVELYMQVGGPTKHYYQTTAIAAELVKYAENTFYATKIAYCYTLAEICRAYGVDYNEVRELWLADPRINPMHTAVFEANDFPFSGKCLPKDLSALIEAGKAVGANVKLLEAVQVANGQLGMLRKARREAENQC